MALTGERPLPALGVITKPHGLPPAESTGGSHTWLPGRMCRTPPCPRGPLGKGPLAPSGSLASPRFRACSPTLGPWAPSWSRTQVLGSQERFTSSRQIDLLFPLNKDKPGVGVGADGTQCIPTPRLPAAWHAAVPPEGEEEALPEPPGSTHPTASAPRLPHPRPWILVSSHQAVKVCQHVAGINSR